MPCNLVPFQSKSRFIQHEVFLYWLSYTSCEPPNVPFLARLFFFHVTFRTCKRKWDVFQVRHNSGSNMSNRETSERRTEGVEKGKERIRGEEEKGKGKDKYVKNIIIKTDAWSTPSWVEGDFTPKSTIGDLMQSIEMCQLCSMHVNYRAFDDWSIWNRNQPSIRPWTLETGKTGIPLWF